MEKKIHNVRPCRYIVTTETGRFLAAFVMYSDASQYVASSSSLDWPGKKMVYDTLYDLWIEDAIVIQARADIINAAKALKQ